MYQKKYAAREEILPGGAATQAQAAPAKTMKKDFTAENAENAEKICFLRALRVLGGEMIFAAAYSPNSSPKMAISTSVISHLARQRRRIDAPSRFKSGS